MGELQTRQTPWFEMWRLAFLEINRCQSFEMLQQPFAIFAVASAEEALPDFLKAIRYLPSLASG